MSELQKADEVISEAQYKFASELLMMAYQKATMVERDQELDDYIQQVIRESRDFVLNALTESTISPEAIVDILADKIKEKLDNTDIIKPKIKIKLIDPSRTDLLPSYAHPGDSGMDVRYSGKGGFHLFPGSPRAVPTGLKFELPKGYEIQVRSKSGLATKGVFVTNSPGTLDNQYRGELFAILTYLGPGKQFYIEPGMKVAQIVLAPYVQGRIQVVDELSETVRGEGRFGSTGT